MELQPECLLRIAAFTDGRTIKALESTDRRWKAIVDRNRLTLPKCTAHLEMTFHAESKTTIFTVHALSINKRTKVFDSEAPTKRMYVAALLDDDDSESEEEKRKLVAQFYEENEGRAVSLRTLPRNMVDVWSTEQSFSLGSSGLEVHLDYILKKVNFSHVSLEGANVEHLLLLFRQLQRYQSKVDHLHFLFTGPLPLTAMPPANIVKSLEIHHVPEGFYRLPSTRQLYELHVDSCDCCDSQLDDDDFCQLNAQVIWINKYQITEQGIRAFITQWSERKRVIESVTLDQWRSSMTDQERIEKWQKMAKSLDPRLIRLGGKADLKNEIDDWYQDYVLLVRLSDGAQLLLLWHSYQVILTTPFELVGGSESDSDESDSFNSDDEIVLCTLRSQQQ